MELDSLVKIYYDLYKVVLVLTDAAGMYQEIASSIPSNTFCAAQLHEPYWIFTSTYFLSLLPEFPKN